MRGQIHYSAATLLITGMCTALLMLSGVANSQELTKDQQKCLNAANKGGSKIVKAQGKDICDCIKNGSKGKLIGTIEDCLTADVKGKVAKAKSKYDAKPGNCDAGVIALADKEIVKQASMDKDLSLIHWIFGSDLDLVIADAATDKDKAKCQKAVAKAAFKCQDEKLKAYNNCKKNKLKGKDTTAATSAQELQDECLGVGTGSIPDPKGKIAKTCGAKLTDTINKKCTAPYDVCFPGCPGAASAADLRDCVDYMVECEICTYLNQIDGLTRDCDLFDDGASNGSCLLTSTKCQYLSTSVMPEAPNVQCTLSACDGVFGNKGKCFGGCSSAADCTLLTIDETFDHPTVGGCRCEVVFTRQVPACPLPNSCIEDSPPF